MATALRVSVVNYCDTATVHSVTSEAAGYPAANALRPEQPFFPWRSTTSGQQDLFINFVASKVVDLVAAIGLNFGSPFSVYFYNDAPAFVTIVGGITDAAVGYNIWSSGYRRAALFTPGITANGMLFRIPASAALSYFDTGGLWAGSTIPLDRDIRWDETMERVEPHLDVAPSHGGWRQRLEMGPAYTRIHARALAVITPTEAATQHAGELAQWLTFNHYMTGGRTCAWYSNRSAGAEDVWIVRRLNDPSVPINQRASEFDLELEECTGP